MNLEQASFQLRNLVEKEAESLARARRDKELEKMLFEGPDVTETSFDHDVLGPFWDEDAE
jgi:hypothetical protein